MTAKRMAVLQDLLAFMGLEGRLHLEWISSAEAGKYVRVVTEFTEKIRCLGPSPLGGRKNKPQHKAGVKEERHECKQAG